MACKKSTTSRKLLSVIRYDRFSEAMPVCSL